MNTCSSCKPASSEASHINSLLLIVVIFLSLKTFPLIKNGFSLIKGCSHILFIYFLCDRQAWGAQLKRSRLICSLIKLLYKVATHITVVMRHKTKKVRAKKEREKISTNRTAECGPVQIRFFGGDCAE